MHATVAVSTGSPSRAEYFASCCRTTVKHSTLSTTRSSCRSCPTQECLTVSPGSSLHSCVSGGSASRLGTASLAGARSMLVGTLFGPVAFILKQVQSKDWWNNFKDITGQRRQENSLQPVADALCLGDMEVLAGEFSMAFQ